MEPTTISCTECGSSDWTRVFDVDYPDRRQERDRTTKVVYTCNECGAEGRYFTHPVGGTDTFSGAMRQ